MIRLCSTLLFFLAMRTSYAQPALFLEGLVSTHLNERDLAISPDGQEMYYTIQANQNAFSTIIRLTKRTDNTWSPPQVAPFSGRFSDLEPAFSPDGKKLFFASNRPLTGDKTKDYDIWVMEKNNGNWSTPKNLGPLVNTEGNEFYPSVAASGNLYFTAEYAKGVGKEDIFVSPCINGMYTESIALDTAVNSSLWEFNAFVSADETYIIFTSYGRKDDRGGGDLYMSVKSADGKWLPAKNLTIINSTKLDYCPFVKGDDLFFTSGRDTAPSFYKSPVNYEALVKTYNSARNGSENIYRINFASVAESVRNR